MLFRKKQSKEEDSTTKKCDECLADIPKKAKRCSKCGAKQKTKYGATHLLLGLFIVFGLIWMFSGNDSISTQSSDAGKAFITAQVYVKSALKSPSSADFPTLDFAAQNLGDNRWQVISYVDSQNSFGAEVRSNWSATLTHLGGNWADPNNWELEELIIDGELIY